MAELGRLESVAVREQWPDEAQHFTPWLALPENLQLLADTIGMPLELEGIEQSVGPYFADLVCLEGGAAEERRVVIENQFGRSNHDHLGKTLTYLAGKGAFTAVWVAEHFTDEHRAAVDWLNEHTDGSKAFWALEIELWRIGESAWAPRFNIVSEPNPVTKAESAGVAELSELRRERLHFWQAFQEYAANRDPSLSFSKPRPETWVNHSVGKAGVTFSLIYSNYDLVEQTYTGEAFVADAVTRVELVLTGERAFERFNQLQALQAEVQDRLPGLPVVWYELAAKERKVFTQRLWPQDDHYSETALFDWFLESLPRMRDVLLELLQPVPVAP